MSTPASSSGKHDLLARFTRQKLHLFRDQIFRLKGSQFPYKQGGEDALKSLLSLADTQLQNIDDALVTNNDKLIQAACSTANSAVARLLPILGFILRSTNVRNSFEYYDGLLGLSKALVSNDAKLIFSSEWMFSPMTYAIGLRDLPNFVLIGLPASEAGNALIIPLAGHEIGHSMWQSHNLEGSLKLEITATLTKEYVANFTELVSIHPFLANADPLQNLFSVTYIGDSLELLMSQCEEIFCDIVGLLLFGEGFLYSFLYLLAPNLGGLRSEDYPTLQTRANYLAQIASSLGHEVPSGFANAFFQTDSSRSDEDAFILKMADVSAVAMIPKIQSTAEAIVNAAAVQLPTPAERDEALKRFDAGIPVQSDCCIADIVNAGWKKRIQMADKRELFETLNDLILKSIEIVEYTTKVAKAE